VIAARSTAVATRADATFRADTRNVIHVYVSICFVLFCPALGRKLSRA